MYYYVHAPPPPPPPPQRPIDRSIDRSLVTPFFSHPTSLYRNATQRTAPHCIAYFVRLSAVNSKRKAGTVRATFTTDSDTVVSTNLVRMMHEGEPGRWLGRLFVGW